MAAKPNTKPGPISIPFAVGYERPRTLGPWTITDVDLGIESETITFRAAAPQVGDIVTHNGEGFEIIEIGEAGAVTLRPVTADSIRGLSSNAVIFDDVVDIDEETLQAVRDQFVTPGIEVREEDMSVMEVPGNPAPAFMDISTVNRPADRVGFVNNREEMEAIFGPPFMP